VTGVRVAVGGTFSVIHRGHLRLLETAFSFGDEVLIGISSDKMASGKGYDVPKLEKRISGLEDALRTLCDGKSFEIRVIGDEVGPAGTERLDAIIVSEESEKGAAAVNRAREGNGLHPLIVIIIPMVRGKGGKVIASRYIIDGRMDKEGKTLSKSA